MSDADIEIEQMISRSLTAQYTVGVPGQCARCGCWVPTYFTIRLCDGCLSHVALGRA